MHRVTLVFILFLLIPDLYIYLVYVVRKTRKAVLHCLYWLPTLLLAEGYVYFIFLTGDNAMSNHTQAIGRLAITIMLFVFPKTIFICTNDLLRRKIIADERISVIVDF